MRPGVALTGRVLDEFGRPVAKADVRLSFLWARQDDSARAWAKFTPDEERITTDAAGHFRIVALVPGLSYSLSVRGRVLAEFRLAANEEGVKKLGDLRP